MHANRFEFGEFTLDAAARRLERDGAPIDCSARYFDALVLMLRDPGGLVTKERFHDEVWRGIPVTDEALTQCIRTLRRTLGDDAANPRFIETVPKHGYRFVAPVGAISRAETRSLPGKSTSRSHPRWLDVMSLGLAAMAGGGAAGIVGGIVYGFASMSASGNGSGALSGLLVLLALNIGVGLFAGAAIGFAIAAVPRTSDGVSPWAALAGAGGGIVGGAFAKLLGLDAFNLLFGHAPRDMTGAPEGALLGAAVGFGTWLARGGTPIRGLACGALSGAVAGLLIPLLGGHMLGGSLDLLARQFPDSHVRLGSIARLFREDGFGPVSQVVTGAIEGTVFGAGVVGALSIGRRYQR